jgi:hypothetical protein
MWFRHPGAGRDPANKTTREADKVKVLSRFAGDIELSGFRPAPE